MRPESVMWRKIRPFLVAARLDPVRIENPIYPGTPDVNVCSGDWMELKTIEAWPRPGLLVRIPHFTPQQRTWLYRRWKYAPRSTHLLLEVRATREYLLFWGDVAAKIVGQEPEDLHRANARAILVGKELEKLPKLLREAVAA